MSTVHIYKGRNKADGYKPQVKCNLEGYDLIVTWEATQSTCSPCVAQDGQDAAKKATAQPTDAQLVNYLMAHQICSDFYKSLADQFTSKSFLSDKQWSIIKRDVKKPKCRKDCKVVGNPPPNPAVPDNPTCGAIGCNYFVDPNCPDGACDFHCRFHTHNHGAVTASEPKCLALGCSSPVWHDCPIGSCDQHCIGYHDEEGHLYHVELNGTPAEIEQYKRNYVTKNSNLDEVEL